MTSKLSEEIENCVRQNVSYSSLPIHLKQILKNSSKNYDRYVVNYSLKNQLRWNRENLVRQIFRNEERYYELLIEKSISNLSIFPYHLSDIVTKGMRVTPFNYYIELITFLLNNDKSYDFMPNFTAADCLRVLGIGRNEYLSLIGEIKTNSSKIFRKPNIAQYLPKFPVQSINILSWWIVEVGNVLESDIKFVNDAERGLIDDLIDFGPQVAGSIDFRLVHSLYRKGLIYLDVPINGNDKISIPPLKNFVMNRISGDYFENLLYKIFISVDDSLNILELSQMLQVNIEIVKDAVSLFCRLGFAKKKTNTDIPNLHESWFDRGPLELERLQITPLNYHALLLDESNKAFINDTFPSSNVNSFNDSNNSTKTEKTEQISTSTEYISSSDGNASDFSIINNSNGSETAKTRKNSPDSLNELSSDDLTKNISVDLSQSKNSGKRVGFLFDSTLTAFLMMGNLSANLKNFAVTLFECGKLCEESMDTFLQELEKVSLLDAEGEGEVGRYFQHAVILRSTIISLRNVLKMDLDLLRIECLENLDCITRDRMLGKKYKFLISAAPLTCSINNLFSIPFFGQFYKSSDNSHIWSRLFYNHLSGYGTPSLLLTKGTVLNSLPRLFLGYGKLLVTIIHTDSYVINSENFRSINDQLKCGCVLLQGFGIRQLGTLHYEAFPFDTLDRSRSKWTKHKAIEKLSEELNLKNTCGYATFLHTGVPDLGCEEFDINIKLQHPKSKKLSNKSFSVIANENYDIKRPSNLQDIPTNYIPDLQSPLDSTEITSFNKNKTIIDSMTCLRSPDENHFANSPQSSSPSNVYRSIDCNEILEKELEKLDESENRKECAKASKFLVSQSSIEIDIGESLDQSTGLDEKKTESEKEYLGEEWTLLDVHFGVPLFDVDCNTKICQHLIKSLATEENLSNLQEINEEMNKKFMTFVSQCLYFEEENMGVVKIGKLIPQPRINLAFENGKICYWSGK